MKNPNLLKNLINNLNTIYTKNSTLSSSKGLSQLVAHLILLDKYMKSDPSSWSDLEHYYQSERVISQLKIVINNFLILLPSYKEIIQNEYSIAIRGIHSPKDFEIYRLLEHCIDILEVNFVGEEKIEEGQIFLGVKEKLKQAGQSFRMNDYPGLFSSLHTAVELTIKERLSIPLSIGEIKIGRVLGICIKKEVFPNTGSLLKDLDDKICQIDNKIKHSGYNPSSQESSDALLIAEQSLKLLEKTSPKLNDEIKKEISSLLI